MRRHSIALAVLFAVSLCSSAFAAEKYEFDKGHTNILFFINHLGFSDMVGEFTDYDGHFTFDQDKPQDSSIDVTLKPAGIRTSSKGLDEHLQKEEFFNSAKFPEMRFVSKSVAVTGKNTGTVTGDLTMLGVTKPVTLNVRFNKADYHPMTKDFIAGFSATATLKRSDFGMNAYVPMVGDEVRLEVHTEGVNLDRKKQDALKKQ